MTHPLVALVSLAALGVYFWTIAMVGQGRGKHQVKAPSLDGPPEFVRLVRIQTNTLEWLPLLLLPLWLFAAAWSDYLAAFLGLVWIVGRILYARAYAKDPDSRTAGFLIQFAACAVLWLGATIGALTTWF